MTNITDSFEKFAELQKKGLEPARHISGAAVEAFETLARKNYAFFGDVLEFAVEQAKLTATATDPKDLFEQQVAATKAFAEIVTERANEYVELGKGFQATAQDVISKDFIEPVQEAAKQAA